MHFPVFESRKTDYSSLPSTAEEVSSSCNGDDSEKPESPAKHYTTALPSSQSRALIYHALLTILGLSGVAYFISSQSSGPRPPQTITCHCGSSVSEALDLGCKYDTLSVSWLPDHCREDELVAEFDRAGPNGSWPYYADKNATIPITIESISHLADLPHEQAIFYTSTGWHIAHCAFYWRKEFRMRAKGLGTESRYDKESHIEHCYEIFMSEDALHEVNVASPVWIGGDGQGNTHSHDA
ncbi:hypothetical protein CGCTS75_v007923 [Colletotrichum tropicale]|nr:hypothetical protein CGCTS75_v007923 [Colletotrichum tropicale]